MIKPELIEDVETFLALAYLLETESADRYEELADNMRDHHDPELEQLFRALGEYSDKHGRDILEHGEGMALPNVASWDFEWESPEGPETTAFEFIEYRMTPERVLQLALHNEQRCRDFYAGIAEKSPIEDIRRLAAEFSDEEDEHVEMLQQRMERLHDHEKQRSDDLDPPVPM